jgi:siderophore synthetase component
MDDFLRVEILGRDKFWTNATMVEWEYQFPDRNLTKDAEGNFIISREWLDDLQKVAEKCFSRVVIAPPNLARRRLFRRIINR